MSFSHSRSFERLPSGYQARLSRCCAALKTTPPEIEPTRQASATVAKFSNGLHVLVSYKTPVAYRLPDGSYVKTPRNHYSRTTDRSVAEFCPQNCVTLDVPAFEDALNGHLRNV